VNARIRQSRETGFTLVEVLVVLAGAGVLGGALMSLLSTQTRFQDANDDSVYVRQNVRVLAELLGGELRGAGAGDLLAAESDSVAVRFDVSRSVVCDTAPGGEVDLFVYDSITGSNVPAGFRGTAVGSPYAAGFRYADGFVPAGGPAAAAATTCRANGADAHGTARASDFRRVSGWSAALGQAPGRGSVVRTYGRSVYRIDASGSAPGALALWRNGQELVSPLRVGSQFEYRLSNGTVLSRVAAGNFPGVVGIRIVATATGRGPAAVGESLVLEIPLRN
jgi:hypothetical protein